MSLPELASQMRQILMESDRGHVWVVLPRGLSIIMERTITNNKWRLACGRVGVDPSQAEVAIVARDFKIPAGIEWRWLQRPDKRPGKRIVYRIAECTWIEEAPCPTS